MFCSRPEFAANAPYLEKNPITGIKVSHHFIVIFLKGSDFQLNSIWKNLCRKIIKMLTSCLKMNQHFLVGAIFPPSCANEADSSWKWSYYFNGETKKVFEKLLDWRNYYFNKSSYLSVWWQKDIVFSWPDHYCVISEQAKQRPWLLMFKYASLTWSHSPNWTHIHWKWFTAYNVYCTSCIFLL